MFEAVSEAGRDGGRAKRATRERLERGRLRGGSKVDKERSMAAKTVTWQNEGQISR